METEMLNIPVLKKVSINRASAMSRESISETCCTPKDNAKACCSPSQSEEENNGTCCAQPDDGSACCN